MTTKLTSDCQPAECQATFTINGERGDQKFPYGRIVTLQADERQAETYLWEVISCPPRCGNLLTGSAQSQARLALLIPGTYIVQLTITKGDCTAQARHTILVGVSEGLPYPHPCPCLSDDDVAAIEQAAGTPNRDNPFVTQEQLDGYLSEEDKAAIEEAAGIPGRENPFITREQLDNYLSREDKAAIENAPGLPGVSNPFMTREQLDNYLSADDIAAIEEATIKPERNNPFITQKHLNDYLSADDKAALENATIKPDGGNPFVTQKHLDNLRQEHFLSQDDIDAIQLAPGAPNKNNPFITQQQLDHYLSADTKAALENATIKPDGGNPFVTQKHLDNLRQEHFLSKDDIDAIQLASGVPNKDNPFITQQQLDHYLSEDKKAAIISSSEAANGQNPFVARSEIITGPKKAAIDYASPTANGDNPFITHREVEAKLAQIEKPETRPVQIIAAGLIDLAQTPPARSRGGLIELVENEPEQGIATLTFEGYDYDHCQRGLYIIKALPLSARVGQQAEVQGHQGQLRPPLITVQLVRFSQRGFQLQMVDLAHLPAGRPHLGLCMIEVSEIDVRNRFGKDDNSG